MTWGVTRQSSQNLEWSFLVLTHTNLGCEKSSKEWRFTQLWGKPRHLSVLQTASGQGCSTREVCILPLPTTPLSLRASLPSSSSSLPSSSPSSLPPFSSAFPLSLLPSFPLPHFPSLSSLPLSFLPPPSPPPSLPPSFPVFPFLPPCLSPTLSLVESVT